MPRPIAAAALALALAACATPPPGRVTGTAEGAAGVTQAPQYDEHVKAWRAARGQP